ncbi:MAG TPA: hypothetical protein VFK19_12780 [Sphingomicrobium sp.]|nr:hypothetical protein [Sphingomicrobium sp.]
MRTVAAFVLVLCGSVVTVTHSKPRAATRPRAAHAIPATGLLKEDDLIAIARLEARTKVDQFAEDPTLAYVGRKFVITLAPKQLATEYDQNTHILSVAPSAFLDFFELTRDVRASRYVGQNAFGVRADIAKERGSAFGVCNPWRFSGLSRLIGSTASGGVRYIAQLDGPAARELSKSIRLRLSGRITRLDRGQPWRPTAVFMEPKLDVAKLDHPYDTIVHQYIVSAAFDKAEWVDHRTDKVISESEVTDRPGQCSVLG